MAPSCASRQCTPSSRWGARGHTRPETSVAPAHARGEPPGQRARPRGESRRGAGAPGGGRAGSLLLGHGVARGRRQRALFRQRCQSGRPAPRLVDHCDGPLHRIRRPALPAPTRLGIHWRSALDHRRCQHAPCSPSGHSFLLETPARHVAHRSECQTRAQRGRAGRAQGTAADPNLRRGRIRGCTRPQNRCRALSHVMRSLHTQSSCTTRLYTLPSQGMSLRTHFFLSA